MEIKRMSSKHKNNKVLYYLKNHLRLLLPTTYFQQQLSKKLERVKFSEKKEIQKRVNYYNQLQSPCQLSASAKKISDLKLEQGSKTYFFDFYEYARYFQQNLKGFFLFGDITHIPEEPSFVKSRPINSNNINSVLLKWNKVRHFIFIKKDRPFQQKKDQLLSRGKVHPTQPQRIRFLELYFKHPLCNIGKVNQNSLNPVWKVERMTIEEQLQYKFILCIEGNDVATNLKWVMSSNSVAVMPKPKFESWFMEGLLVPDYHYISLKDDYSDLEEKLTYYIQHPKAAEEIIKNAHRFVQQFKNKEKENLISLLVLKKYFNKTGQL